MSKKRLEGEVTSNKMQATVVVKVDHLVKHHKYKKYYKVSKKYKADTAGKTFTIGDKVTIEETNPISKDKRWIVVA